jgi:hypothetical protein
LKNRYNICTVIKQIHKPKGQLQSETDVIKLNVDSRKNGDFRALIPYVSKFFSTCPPY